LPRDHAGVVIPLRLRSEHGVLSFLSTTTVFGTPVEVTLEELALETFFPADARTAEVLGLPRAAKVMWQTATCDEWSGARPNRDWRRCPR
jgi:hypothetical protein